MLTLIVKLTSQDQSFYIRLGCKANGSCSCLKSFMIIISCLRTMWSLPSDFHYFNGVEVLLGRENAWSLQIAEWHQIEVTSSIVIIWLFHVPQN